MNKRFLPLLIDDFSKSVEGIGIVSFKKLSDDHEITWQVTGKSKHSDLFKALSFDDSKKQLRNELGTLYADLLLDFIKRDFNSHDHISRVRELELDWRYWSIVSTDQMPIKTKRHIYTRPNLDDEKILYKGKRYWVVEVKDSNKFFGYLSKFDYFVWDGVYDAVIGVAKLKENGSFHCETLHHQGSVVRDATNFKDVVNSISFSIEELLDHNS
jgi:hypothetical protein